QLNEEQNDLQHIRADLQEVLERRAGLTDAERPEAVAKRRKTGQRTARENLAELLDDGSFMEYGGFALAAQRTRRSHEDLLKMSPADGLIAGIGTVNAELFGAETARCMAMSYDYTVFAGTQGVMNHKKTDRMLELAEQWRLPLVFSPRAVAADRGMWTRSAWPAWIAPPSCAWPGSAARYRWLAWCRGAASPVTPHCSAAAM